MFTKQELIYLALGMRKMAQEALRKADSQPALATREALQAAAKQYAELAAKCERLQESPESAAPGGPAAGSPQSAGRPSPPVGTPWPGPGARGGRGIR